MRVSTMAGGRWKWQVYWSGLPFSPPETLPYPGIERSAVAPALQADSLASEPSGKS